MALIIEACILLLARVAVRLQCRRLYAGHVGFEPAAEQDAGRIGARCVVIGDRGAVWARQNGWFHKLVSGAIIETPYTVT